ncbi:hypothetical protein GJ689_14805 [Rhodoplanes serenus]|uniref:Secreted protein n=1 Tax=Rhodoplanes serenus TaxID=200615 RepID=A0A9X4XLP9_9BRAD|nr:hypothetical protein [Rhodoplanes serenus]MTW17472.1 hypothetical protein [Rhodoplanes serenus]
MSLRIAFAISVTAATLLVLAAVPYPGDLGDGVATSPAVPAPHATNVRLNKTSACTQVVPCSQM